MDSRLPDARPASRPKRVVIVDDSDPMRLWLRHVFDADDRLIVVGEASDAKHARAMIKQVRPDVVTLDIDMPGMSGMDFLSKLMQLNPLPVVMISGATAKGSAQAVRCLQLGAVDCVLKPQPSNVARCKQELVQRVYGAACSTAHPGQVSPAKPTQGELALSGNMPIVLIAASTGGVAAVDTVLRGLNPAGPPVVIVQHMPSNFLKSFVEMLDRGVSQDVAIVEDGAPLSRGQVRLAPSAAPMQTLMSCHKGVWHARVAKLDQPSEHYPSADVLFTSAKGHAADTISAVLTGLGQDGAAGMKILRAGGGQTLAQDAESSVVYGMPRAAFESGAADVQVPLAEMGFEINQRISLHQSRQNRGRQ